MRYIDWYQQITDAIEMPGELLLKDLEFKNQSEIRIIINSSSPKYLEYINQNELFEIESLEDITEINDYYFEDMKIERCGNKGIMFSLSESKKFDLKDLNFFDCLDLIRNILAGRVEIINGPDKTSTWNEKLKPLLELMEEKFGAIVTVDESKFISLRILNPELQKQFDERINSDKKSVFSMKMKRLLAESRIDEVIDECVISQVIPELKWISFFYLAKAYYEKRQLDDAIRAYLTSYENDCMRIESLDGIASIYVFQGNYKKAIETYIAIQEEKGYDPKIYGNIGICYLNLNQLDDAIESFDKGLQIDNKDAFLHYNLGVVLYKKKLFGLSKECMTRAIELEPGKEKYRQEFNKLF